MNGNQSGKGNPRTPRQTRMRRKVGTAARAVGLLAALFAVPSAANGLSDGIIAGDIQQQTQQGLRPGQTTFDQNLSQDNGMGREHKAGDSANTAGTGQAAATAIGSTMIATGAPMIPSIIPSVSAAGADLVAKGITELVQAAADGGAKDQNNGQQNLLTQNADGGQGAGAGGGVNPANIQLPQQLQQLLQDHGVNPQDFAAQAAAGQIQNGNDLLQALGMPTVSGEDLANGQAMAQTQLSSIMGSDPTNPTTVRLGENESAPAVGQAGSGNLDPSALAGSGAQTGVLQEHSASKTAAAATGSPDGTTAVAGNGTPDPSQMVKEMMQQLGLGKAGTPEEAAASAAKRQRLASLGVLPPQPKQNIFQIAHRNFRSYQKWRSMRQRLAQK